MNLNFIDKKTEADYNKILQLIKLRKNGVVSDALRNSGFKYDKIWGVSIPHLRNIAGTFSKNNTLSQLLWNKKWRETMILATMLAEIEVMDDKDLEAWLSEVNNLELAEQIAFNLLSNVERKHGYWLDLIKNTSDYQRISVLKGLYRSFLMKKNNVDFAVGLFEGITALPVTEGCSVLEIKAFGQLYACMGRTYPDLIKPILAFIYKFVGVNSSWEAMREIAETEFNWLNET